MSLTPRVLKVLEQVSPAPFVHLGSSLTRFSINKEEMIQALEQEFDIEFNRGMCFDTGFDIVAIVDISLREHWEMLAIMA